MYVDKYSLLRVLPPYRDEWVTIHEDQQVKDIISEMVEAHIEFAPYYDLIAPFFLAGSVEKICEKLFAFCKKNIRYQEEGDKAQTTALPTGILTRGTGDCKHYASFIGGVLDAIKRATGQRIDWYYCFASYKLAQRTPYHVFVVVNTRGGTLWVDPTPGAEGKIPVWTIDKRI